MSSSSGSIIRGMRHLGQSEILSTPAAAPLASSSLQEAKLRARRLFREICKEVPWILKNYQLDEVTTVQRLRSQIATHFRQVPTDNYKVIDVRLFKARAEMTNVLAHHTQRHHLITKYVAESATAKISDRINQGQTAFLTNFYKSATV